MDYRLRIHQANDHDYLTVYQYNKCKESLKIYIPFTYSTKRAQKWNSNFDFPKEIYIYFHLSAFVHLVIKFSRKRTIFYTYYNITRKAFFTSVLQFRKVAAATHFCQFQYFFICGNFRSAICKMKDML